MGLSHIDANRTERERLLALLDRLTDADLEQRLPNGQSIAELLVHLAFWDRYARDVLAMWQRDGLKSSRTHYAAINAAVRLLGSAIPVRAAVELARESAEAADSEAARVPADLAQAIIAGGKVRTLERAQHRREHLDQIQRLLDSTQARGT